MSDGLLLRCWPFSKFSHPFRMSEAILMWLWDSHINLGHLPDQSPPWWVLGLIGWSPALETLVLLVPCVFHFRSENGGVNTFWNYSMYSVWVVTEISPDLSIGPDLHSSGILPCMFLHGLSVSVLGPSKHRDWICHFPHWHPSILHLHLLQSEAKVASEVFR